MKNGYSFFGGANSAHGFVSYYSSIDSDRENEAVFNIVGGPGTGKSSLMKKIAALPTGDGWLCEKYFCSSDPSSIDAVRLISRANGRSIFVCDATAPHARDLSTPGATGRLIDLSRWWDVKKLMLRKDEIIDLQNEKKNYYVKAYRYLRIAGLILEEAFSARKRQLDLESLKRDILDYINGQGVTPSVKRPVRSVSMLGEKTIDNDGYSAKRKLFIPEQIDCAILLELLLEDASASLLAPHPVVNSLFDEAYFPESDLCVSCVSPNRSLAFECADYALGNKDDYSKLRDSYQSYVDLAIKELAGAKVRHFALEGIYGEAVNFELKEKYDEEIVKDVSLLME